MEQSGHIERDTGVPSHQLLGVGMRGRVHTEVRGLEKELEAEASLLAHREPERIAIEGRRLIQIVDENGERVDMLNHDPAGEGDERGARFRKAAAQLRRIPESPGRSSGVSPNRAVKSSGVIRSKNSGSPVAIAPRSR